MADLFKQILGVRTALDIRDLSSRADVCRSPRVDAEAKDLADLFKPILGVRTTLDVREPSPGPMYAVRQSWADAALRGNPAHPSMGG